MPVFPIVENVVFRPPLLELMGDAFDTAMGSLSVVPSKIAQEAMANRIIQAAHEGERDMDRLREVALTGMDVPRLTSGRHALMRLNPASRTMCDVPVDARSERLLERVRCPLIS
jgi:hypothetical protein